MYGAGFESVVNNLPVLVDLGVIVKSGAFFDIGGEKVQGKENAIEYLRENPDVYGKLYAQGRDLMLAPPKPPASQPTPETEELPSLEALEELADQQEQLR